MRVLLGHSYFLRFDPKLWQAMQPYPPLGTLIAAALLREHDHDVRLFDAMLADSTAQWDAMLDAEHPDVAVLFEDNFNYLSKMCLLNMRDAAFAMIAAANARGIRVIVAGADVTDHAQDYLDRGASFALIGEGDETLCELLSAFESGEADFGAIQGLAYIQREALVTTPRRAVIRDLDALPLPARDLIDLERYRAAWRPHGRFSMNVVTSRGCPFHCNWCAKPIWGQRYGVRGAASVADEIEQLRVLGVDHVWFMDDIFGLKPGWVPEFAALVEAHGVRTPFKSLARADLLLRPGEITALKRAGAEMVWLGAESGAQHVLDAMEKGTTVQQIREAARQLHEAGIGVAFFLQFGYPGETWADIEATLQLVWDCNPDDVGMSVSYPLPGTSFFERVRNQLSGRQNWVDSSDLAMLYNGPYPTSFYRRLHSRLHTEFRLRKATGERAWPAVAMELAAKGQLKRSAAVLRDATTLPLQRGLLALERRRAPHDASILPVELSRMEAATPSAQQEEPAEAAASRQP